MKIMKRACAVESNSVLQPRPSIMTIQLKPKGLGFKDGTALKSLKAL